MSKKIVRFIEKVELNEYILLKHDKLQFKKGYIFTIIIFIICFFSIFRNLLRVQDYTKLRKNVELPGMIFWAKIVKRKSR